MTNTLRISEPNMMMKYAMKWSEVKTCREVVVLKTCSVGESGSYVHCGDAVSDAELELVKFSLVFVVIFEEESSVAKKKERRNS